MDNMPPVLPSLVEWLERVHPLRPPDPKQPAREIWMEAGRQDLIAKLRLAVKQQAN